MMRSICVIPMASQRNIFGGAEAGPPMSPAGAANVGTDRPRGLHQPGGWMAVKTAS